MTKYLILCKTCDEYRDSDYFDLNTSSYCDNCKDVTKKYEESIDESHLICPSCDKLKPICSFWKLLGKNGKKNPSSICRHCFNENKSSEVSIQKYCKMLVCRLRDNIYFKNQKPRVKKINRIVTAGQLVQLYKHQGGVSAVSGRKFTLSVCRTQHMKALYPQNMVIELLFTDQGYSEDNIRLVCADEASTRKSPGFKLDNYKLIKNKKSFQHDISWLPNGKMKICIRKNKRSEQIINLPLEQPKYETAVPELLTIKPELLTIEPELLSIEAILFEHELYPSMTNIINEMNIDIPICEQNNISQLQNKHTIDNKFDYCVDGFDIFLVALSDMQ